MAKPTTAVGMLRAFCLIIREVNRCFTHPSPPSGTAKQIPAMVIAEYHTTVNESPMRHAIFIHFMLRKISMYVKNMVVFTKPRVRGVSHGNRPVVYRFILVVIRRAHRLM